MKPENNHWKIPVALGMVACSLMPVALVCFIDAIDFSSSEWAYKQHVLPPISWNFRSCYLIGYILPILTTAVAIWFAKGRSVTAKRLAWAVFLLIILHLFWLSWGILAFYLANQKFVMF
jgi:hypothetical protein